MTGTRPTLHVLNLSIHANNPVGKFKVQAPTDLDALFAQCGEGTTQCPTFSGRLDTIVACLSLI